MDRDKLEDLFTIVIHLKNLPSKYCTTIGFEIHTIQPFWTISPPPAICCTQLIRRRSDNGNDDANCYPIRRAGDAKSIYII